MEQRKTHTLALPVTLFLVSLALPFLFFLGGLRLSPYRVILLIMIFPLLYFWVSGRAGRIRVADIAIVFHCFWLTLSFAVIHGAQVAFETGAIMTVETLGAYLLARCYIRNASDFYHMVRVLFFVVMVLMPFAIFELLTGRNILLEIMNSVWMSHHRVGKDPRWGLQRVQATFEHPILYGVFCGSVIGLTHFVLGYSQSVIRRATKTFLVLMTASFTLSSGPIAGMAAQVLLILYNAAFAALRSRWKLLLSALLALYILLELVANSSAPEIFIRFFSFNQASAYYRLHIWTHGTTAIAQSPLFGYGFNSWPRPAWMAPSIDMFWILHAVRNGLPAQLLLVTAFFLVYIQVFARKGLNDMQSSYRIGYLLCLTSLFISGWTVHFWNSTHVLFIFFIGSGVWFLDTVPEQPKISEPEDEPHRHLQSQRGRSAHLEKEQPKSPSRYSRRSARPITRKGD